MRLLLVGHGRMGRLVETLAPQYGDEVAGVLDGSTNVGGRALVPDRWRSVDVAIDFSTSAAFVGNLPRLAALGINLVVGTTGWQSFEAEARKLVADAGIGLVASANFSLGANVLEALVEQAARLLAAHQDYGAWLDELHHAAKRDRPSGTALMLRRAMEQGGYPREIPIASTRAGAIPGTHTVGFDGPFETLTLTHTVRDRATFARGALEAAHWIAGKRGWFSMRDVLRTTYARPAGDEVAASAGATTKTTKAG